MSERYREVIAKLPSLDADFDGVGEALQVALVRVAALTGLRRERAVPEPEPPRADGKI